MSQEKEIDLRKLAESGTNEEIEIYLGNVDSKQFRKDVKNISRKEFTANDFLNIVCAVFIGFLVAHYLLN